MNRNLNLNLKKLTKIINTGQVGRLQITKIAWAATFQMMTL